MLQQIFYLFLIVVTLTTCKKKEERICWKGSGDIAQKIIYFDSTTTKGFAIYDGLNIRLIKDSVSYLEITSYKNLIHHIKVKKEDSLLALSDENKCNFLRQYEKQTQIDVHYTSLSVLNLKGKGTIETTSPISSEILHIYANTCNSTVNLDVMANSLVVKTVNGTISGAISGIAQSANIYHYGYSKLNFVDLKVNHLFLENKSNSDVSVYAIQQLILDLKSIGTIYYKGNPNIIITNNKRNSKVIAITP